MDISQFGPRPKSIYRKREFEDFQRRLAQALVSEALDSTEIQENAQYSEYAANFYATEIVDKVDSLADNRIVRVPAIMKATGTKSGTRFFPIVNEYRGHDLINAYYFSKIETAPDIEVRHQSVIVVPKLIITK